MKKIVLFLAILMAFSCLIISCSDAKKDITTASATTPIKDCWTVPYDYDFAKYVDLSDDDYIGLTYTELKSEVDDDDVQYEIQKLLEEHATYTDITDRGAENGDFVTIDYKGFMDGKELEKGSENDAEFILGEAGFIPGFEDGILSHKPGESFTLDLVFPADYGNTDLQNKAVQFEITVKKLQTKTLPALDDKFVEENTDYTSIGEYYAGIAAELQASLDSSNKVAYKNKLFEKVVANVTVKKIPQNEYDLYYNQVISQYAAYAEQYGMKFEQFISDMMGSTVDEFFEFAKTNAKSNVETELIYFAIADKVGIIDKLTKADYDDYLVNIAAEYQQTPESFTAMYGTDTVLRSLVWDSVMDYVLANATPEVIEDEATTENVVEEPSVEAETESPVEEPAVEPEADTAE